MSDMSDYIKIEEFKHLLVSKLRSIGLQKYLDVATDKDMDNLIKLANTLLLHMKERDDKDVQIELLITYILGLWARLLIEHGADAEDL